MAFLKLFSIAIDSKTWVNQMWEQVGVRIVETQCSQDR